MTETAGPAVILITGAGGFVGPFVLAALDRAFPGARIVAASRRPQDGAAVLDVTDRSMVEELVERLQPQACIHLAAQSSVGRSLSDPRETWGVNLGGTLILAEAILRVAPTCRLVFASSAEVYGLSFREQPVIAESAALAPANPYAASKAAADLALGEMALRGLDVVRLRLFNHTGPCQSQTFVIPAFARQVALIEAGRQAPVIRTGALDRWRDFLDVHDVAEAYCAAVAARDLPAGAAINIASGTARRVGDVLAQLLELADLQAEIVEEPPPARRNDVQTSAGSPIRARDLLGWEPRHAWAATLAAILDHWRAAVAREAGEAR